MTETERYNYERDMCINQAKILLSKMNKEQAIFFCEELGSRLPNRNFVSPIHWESYDRYMQFWRFGVITEINKL